jgi:predicted transcriptional regulator
MRLQTLNGVISSNPDRNNESMADDREKESMGKEERKRQVLGLLVESDLALPPAVILWNAKDRGATFERRTLDNYLEELVEDGYVKKADEKRGYYRATADGRDHYLNF